MSVTAIPRGTFPRSSPASRTAALLGGICVLLSAVSAAGPVASAGAAGATGTGTAAATTQAGTGSSLLTLEGRGLRALRKQGVRMSATRPVRVSRGALSLPVSTGALASTVRLDSKGALVLRKGRRKLKLVRAPGPAAHQDGLHHRQGGQAANHRCGPSSPRRARPCG